MWGGRATHVLGTVVVNLRGASGNTPYWVLLLVYVGYCFWLCCASSNTLYWLLLVYEGHRTTHFTGYCYGLWEVSGSTHYWASLGLMWGAFFRNCFSEYPLTNKITWHCFPVSQLTSTNVPQSDKSHIHKFAPSPYRPEASPLYRILLQRLIQHLWGIGGAPGTLH
jgi:hypothetical protein